MSIAKNTFDALYASRLLVKIASRTALATQPFRLGRGELLGVFGTNGAGKSTFLRTLAGELTLLTGDIRYHDHDVTRLDAFARSRAGLRFLPQANNTFTGLTVAENLQVVTRSRRTRFEVTQRFESVLPLVPMNKPVHLLSGGEQQTLAVLMFLSETAGVYLLDEPYAGVDADISLALRAVVHDCLKESGAAAVIIGHDRDQLEADCDRISDMSDMALIETCADLPND